MIALYLIIFIIAAFTLTYYSNRADKLSSGVIVPETQFDVKLKRWYDIANQIGAVIGGIIFILIAIAIAIAIVVALFSHFGWWAIFFLL